MENKMTFNEDPEAYHKYRPSYPIELIEDLVSYSGIKDRSNIIEVGCGTGKATQLFAKYDFDITGIEIGKNLVDFAKQLFIQNPNVKIINSSFEDWDSKGEKFDLLVSAQAFHWINPEIKYKKAASILKKGGSIGVFWNMHDEHKTDFLKEYDEIYKAINPIQSNSENKKREAWIIDILDEMKNADLFENISEKTYKWKTQYNEEQFVNLLNTYSDIHMWEESPKRRLNEEIHKLFEKHGEIIDIQYNTISFFAKVK